LASERVTELVLQLGFGLGMLTVHQLVTALVILLAEVLESWLVILSAGS
jgi:hypothetical protein